ncbi:unnamed protein product [Closterium sp. Naga37s-1]|nr:unnamed protein product [Closterium sp. Naga37s-1]
MRVRARRHLLRAALCSVGSRSHSPLSSPVVHSFAEPLSRRRQPCLATRASSAAQAGAGDQVGATPLPEGAATKGPAEPDSFSSEPSCSGGKRRWWEWQAWRGRESLGERVMSGIVNSSSAPIGSFIMEPVTAAVAAAASAGGPRPAPRPLCLSRRPHAARPAHLHCPGERTPTTTPPCMRE